MTLLHLGDEPRLVAHEVEATRSLRLAASGRSIVADPAARPYSKARNSGSSSSQLSSRPRCPVFGCTALKSGARNGLAICAWRTDCGTTWRCTATGTGVGSVAMMSSSGLSSAPEAMSMSRRSLRAESVTVAFSASS